MCEGCGDCGEKSTCLSVQPVETEFGRKTHDPPVLLQPGLLLPEGRLPVVRRWSRRGRRGEARQAARGRSARRRCPTPCRACPRDVLVRMPGIGGTGVVTVSQILQMAAHLDGLYAAGLEQTGLAQKGGPVISDLRIAAAPIDGPAARRAGGGRRAARLRPPRRRRRAETLAVADPERTVAVRQHRRRRRPRGWSPTRAPLPRRRTRRCGASTAVTRAERGAPPRRPGDRRAAVRRPLPANLAARRRRLPARLPAAHAPAAIEQAIRAERAAASRRTSPRSAGAGRPSPIPRPCAPPLAPRPSRRRGPAARSRSRGAGRPTRCASARAPRLPSSSPTRAPPTPAATSTTSLPVARAHRSEASAVDRGLRRGLFKLMAYKDEYEVARLHLSTPRARRAARPSSAAGARARIMLHPPLLRALGMKRKIARRPLRHARCSARCVAAPPPARHAARPVRPRRGPPRRARARRRVPASSSHAALEHRTPRTRAPGRRHRRAARRHPRLRGDQARGTSRRSGPRPRPRSSTSPRSTARRSPPRGPARRRR